ASGESKNRGKIGKCGLNRVVENRAISFNLICRAGRRAFNLKYHLAIFDFDGTLADTLPWMRSIFNELAEAHDFRRVEAHEFERFRDIHGTALLRELGLPLWKLPRVMNDMRRRMAAHTETLSLFPGMSDAL